MVGPVDEEGEESFDFVVCTPTWLASCIGDKRLEFGHGYLLVSEYDYSALRDELSRLIGECEGDRWSDVTTQIARYGRWEFQDYQG